MDEDWLMHFLSESSKGLSILKIAKVPTLQVYPYFIFLKALPDQKVTRDASSAFLPSMPT